MLSNNKNVINSLRLKDKINIKIYERKLESYKEDQLKICQILFNNGEYKTLKEIIKYLELKDDDLQNTNKLLDFYYYWDNMNYDKIVSYTFRPFPTLFKEINNQYQSNVKGWKKLKTYPHEYVISVDLINKSKRCNDKSQYNESILYLYRACELITHLQLLEHYQINTFKINRNQLSNCNLDYDFIDSFCSDNWYVNSNISLRNHFKLLSQLGDVLGEFYELNKYDFNDIINIRHTSMLAHGISRITHLQYEKFEYLIKELLELYEKNSLKLLKLTQFPKFKIT